MPAGCHGPTHFYGTQYARGCFEEKCTMAEDVQISWSAHGAMAVAICPAADDAGGWLPVEFGTRPARSQRGVPISNQTHNQTVN